MAASKSILQDRPDIVLETNFQETNPNLWSNVKNINPEVKALKTRKRTPSIFCNENDGYQHFYGLNLINIFSDILSHPFIVLRRQCQVNRISHSYHMTPFTLVPVVINLHRRQGMSTLWKGIGSIFILKGITSASETILSELTSLPRELSDAKGFTGYVKYFILKGLSSAVVTPFLAASVMETVQSDVASEKPGILDFIKEGFCRIVRWNTPQSTRLLPIWIVAIPTITYYVLQCMISSLIENIMRRVVEKRLKKNDPQSVPKNYPNIYEYYYPKFFASFMAHLISDSILYPLETVLNRLHIQGTRTIIDNLDTGMAVVPIISKYEGMTDSFNAIIVEEGVSGFFKGFGALIVQYSLQVFILKGTKLILKEISTLYKQSKTD